jgi:hypothetical protein
LDFWLKENDQCKFQLPENNTNAIVLDPPLPTLIDLPTIFRLFFPSEGMLNESSVSDKTKRSYWHVMESVGDSVILLILRDILVKIFGDRSSLAFLKVVEDHAKGSEFLGQIAKYYNLQHWCRLLPRDITEWANLCEAWVGAVFLSDSIWVDHFYECAEIMKWYQEISMIRYRGLFPYISKSWLFFESHDFNKERKERVRAKSRVITYPKAPGFEECNMCPQKDPGIRFIGYLAVAYTDDWSIQATEFNSSKRQAEYLARRAVQTQLSESNSSIQSESNNDSKGSERKFPFIARQSNSVQKLDIFSTYRKKCFDAILSSLSSENPEKFPENLLDLSDTYQSWLDSLSIDDSSNLKTRAMLSWNLVISFF